MARTILRVSGIVSLVEIVPPHPYLRTRAFEDAAREAILTASDEAGGSPMVHDDDLMLDQEATGGNMDLALRIIAEELEWRGFESEVIWMQLCPTCEDGPMAEWCPTCLGKGEVLPGTPPAEPRGAR